MKKERLEKYLPLILFILSFGILLYKCFYSFCWSDESFYFSTAYRFLQGDSIFKHDWFPTQLSSVILLPFFYIFTLISGQTTGILLYFRILFVIFSTLNALVSFLLLKKSTGSFTAMAYALCIMFYTHLNIATLSYYTISTQCFLMAMVLIYSYVKSERKGKYLFYAGISYALSVLALPTMAVGYLLTVITLLLLLLYKKLKPQGFFSSCIDKELLLDILKYTLAGIVIPAIFFFIFLYSNVSLSDFIRSIPYVLSDDEHGTSFIYPLKKFFTGINESFAIYAYLYYLLILICFSFRRILIRDKGSLVVLTLDLLLFIPCLTKVIPHTGYIFTLIVLFSLPLFFMTKKPDLPAFFIIFIQGMIFSLVYSYSSNGYLYILSMGHFIASAAAFIFIKDFLWELKELIGDEKGSLLQKLPSILLFTLFTVTCLTTIALRLTNIYRDAPMHKLTERISDGPAKGLYTTKEHLRKYETVLDTINNYCKKDSLKVCKNETLLLSKLLPFGYLCSDLKVAAPTTWRNKMDSERLMEYYELNPDRFPDVVLILNKEYGSYDSCGDVESDPIPNENSLKGELMDILNSDKYERIECECGIIYRLCP